jgi:hypothetical protein
MKRKNTPGCNCCGCGLPINEIKRVKVSLAGDHYSYAKEWDPWENKGTDAGFATRDRSKSYWHCNGAETSVGYYNGYSWETWMVCTYYLYPDQQLYTGIAANATRGDTTLSELWATEAESVIAGQSSSDFVLYGWNNSYGRPCNYSQNTTLIQNYYLGNIFEPYVVVGVLRRVSDGLKLYTLTGTAVFRQVFIVNHTRITTTYNYATMTTTSSTSYEGRDFDLDHLPIGPNRDSILGNVLPSPNFGDNDCSIATRFITPWLGAEYIANRIDGGNVGTVVRNGRPSPIQTNTTTEIRGDFANTTIPGPPPRPWEPAQIAFESACSIPPPTVDGGCGCESNSHTIPATSLPILVEGDPASTSTSPLPATCHTRLVGISNRSVLTVESLT